MHQFAKVKWGLTNKCKARLAAALKFEYLCGFEPHFTKIIKRKLHMSNLLVSPFSGFFKTVVFQNIDILLRLKIAIYVKTSKKQKLLN